MAGTAKLLVDRVDGGFFVRPASGRAVSWVTCRIGARRALWYSSSTLVAICWFL